MELKQLLATCAAAAALAASLVGPVVKVLRSVQRHEHPAVKRFEGVAGQYRKALRWSEE